MPPNQSMPSIDWAPEAILIIGRDGVIVDANRAAEAQFRYRREALRSRAVRALLPEFSPEDVVEAGPQQAAGVRTAATTARRRDGSRFAARLSWLSLPEGLGGHLVVSVREAHAGRGAPTGEEVAALRQQRDLFALFNHDVRQSLQSIQFLCDSIIRKVPETAATISEIVGAVKTLLDTIVRLGDAGPVVPSVQACTVGDVLHALGRELRPIAERKGLELVIAEAPDQVRTDPVLLRELLQNLMANAVRYTPSGSVSVQCVPGTSSVRIDIVDTGVGIDSEQLRTLFAEPRLAAGLPPTRGSGLGLAIAGRLADVLGCRIEASSRPGEGSRFSVVVPRGGGDGRDRRLRVPGGEDRRSSSHDP